MTAGLFPATQREQLCLFHVRIRPDISPELLGLSQSPANQLVKFVRASHALVVRRA